jgi:hypothetical protein
LAAMKSWFSLMLLSGTTAASSAPVAVTVRDVSGAAARSTAPVSVHLDMAALGLQPSREQCLLVKELNASQPAQFEPEAPGSTRGRLWWLMPPGDSGERKFRIEAGAVSPSPAMQARQDPAGQWLLSDSDKPILRYNYQTNEPGELLAKVHPGNRKYARARSDYIHPLYGPEGEELTLDWPIDHPHHRGIYWAWPEVDYLGQRGDLHALQRVFTRPTGQCAGQSGSVFAGIEAENLWLWEDREPIVRERAVIRAWRGGPRGRCIDLEFHLTALKSDVALARRDTTHYGGLNIRLAKVKDQRINLHTDPAETNPRMAWAELFGLFNGGSQPLGLVVFQHPANPQYPGDWIQYPDLNWLQPTFPASGARYLLHKDQPLVLRFRLWLHTGQAAEQMLADVWTACANPPEITLEDEQH